MKDTFLARTGIIVSITFILSLSLVGISANPARAADTITNNSTYYIGQELMRDSNISSSENISVVYESNQTILTTTANSSGVIEFDTNGFPSGNYELINENNTSIAHYFMENQTMTNSVTGEPMYKYNGRDPSANVTIDSNRGGYDIVITSNDISTSDLDNVLNKSIVLTDLDGDGDNEAVYKNANATTAFGIIASEIPDTREPTVNFTFYAADTTANTSSTVDFMVPNGIQLKPSSPVIYSGQRVFNGTGVVSGDTVKIKQNGTTVQDDDGNYFQFTVNNSSFVSFETDGLEKGMYSFYVNGNKQFEFEIGEGNFTMELDPNKVYNSTDETSITRVTVSASPSTYTFLFEVGSLNASEIDARTDIDFSVYDYDGDGTKDAVRTVQSSQLQFEFTAANMKTGTYTVTSNMTITSNVKSSKLEVDERILPKVKFSKRMINESQGDIIRVPIRYSNTTQAVLEFGGGPGQNYYANVTIVDGGATETLGDANGKATLLINTHKVGHENSLAFSTADGKDKVEINTAQSLPKGQRLEGGVVYWMNLSTTNGVLHDVNSVNLTDPRPFAIDRSQMMVASGFSYEGKLHKKSSRFKHKRIASVDVAIAKFEVHGIEGQLGNKFFRPADSFEMGDKAYKDTGLFIYLTDMNGDAKNTPDLQMSDGYVASRLSNDALYVVFPLNKTSKEMVGERYNVSLMINPENNYYYNEWVEQNTSFQVVEPRIMWDDTDKKGRVNLTAKDNSTLAADTTLAPGTSVNLSFKTYEPYPYFSRKKIIVRDIGSRGRFRVEYDIKHIPPFHNGSTNVGLLYTETTPRLQYKAAISPLHPPGKNDKNESEVVKTRTPTPTPTPTPTNNTTTTPTNETTTPMNNTTTPTPTPTPTENESTPQNPNEGTSIVELIPFIVGILIFVGVVGGIAYLVLQTRD